MTMLAICTHAMQLVTRVSTCHALLYYCYYHYYYYYVQTRIVDESLRGTHHSTTPRWQIENLMREAERDKLAAVMKAVEAGQATSAKETKSEVALAHEAAARTAEGLATRRVELAVRDYADKAKLEREEAVRCAVEAERAMGTQALSEAEAQMRRTKWDAQLAVEEMRQDGDRQLASAHTELERLKNLLLV